MQWGVENCMMEIVYVHSPHPAKYCKMTNKLTKDCWTKHPMRGLTFGKGVKRQLQQRQQKANMKVARNLNQAIIVTPYKLH